MRRPAVFALAVTLGVIAALGLASCGGGDDAKLLPGATAQEITENVDQVQLLVDEGECVGAADAALEVSAQVEALGGVDAKLKRTLQGGATRLNEVVAECEEATTEAIMPTTEETTTEESEPPGQEKKQEKEVEKAEKEAEKEESPKEKPEPPEPPTTTTETPPTTPPEEVPPTESGGTGASGGVSPGAPVGGGE